MRSAERITPGVNSGRDHFPGAVHFHDDAHHQPVDLRIERADAVRKLLGQHGNGAIGKIDRRAAQARLAIERRTAADVMRHVRDVHLQARNDRLAARHVHRIVEIARRFAINRDDRQIAEIAAAVADPLRATCCGAARASPITSSGNMCGKWCLRMMISTSTPISPGRPRISITRPAGASPPFGKSRDFDVDHRAIEFRQPHAADRHSGRAAGGIREFLSQRRAVSSSPGGIKTSCRMRVSYGSTTIAVRAVAEEAHDRRMLALDDLHDAPFRAAIGAAPLDAREHAVAVHRVADVVAAYEKSPSTLGIGSSGTTKP